ncbi:MAG: hypothetical protein QOG68_814, partial [Solirubrobacteraceae bacterium]|nr:hypothetical protein [Solirubrobacteraceae bacterium]
MWTRRYVFAVSMPARPPDLRHLPVSTRAFLLAVLVAAAGAVVATSLLGAHHQLDVVLLGVTIGLCAGAALFEVLAPGNVSLHVSLVFFAWGAILLPPWAIGALAVASFAASALSARTRWYVGTFNVANYALAGLAAHAVSDAIAPVHGGHVTTTTALGLLAAATTLVVVNHILIVAVVRLAHGHTLARATRESLVAVPVDLSLALGGAFLAAVWSDQHALALLGIGPLLLMYRGLATPMLRHKSRLDPKTGLYNFEHFGVVLGRSLREAERNATQVGVLMIDLDHLRAVNNRWGHLAGDQLIRGAAEVIAAELQPCDVAARFGGEEFCVVLPGAATQRSLAVAEAIRQRMAESRWDLIEGGERLSATVSIGVGVFPEHGRTHDAILDAADAAVYDAKLGGRNRVRLGVAAETSRSVAAAAEAQAAANTHLMPVVAAPLVPAPGDPAPPEAAPEAPEAGEAQRIFLPGVFALVAATIVVALLSSTHQIAAEPGVFIALVLGVLLLDLIRIDVFEGGQVSPAAVPGIALAMLFGPLGPISAEAVIAVSRLVRRQSTVGLLADFGMLSLTGAATAGVWIAIGPTSHPALLGGGAVAGLASYAVNAALMLALMSLGSSIRPLAAWREGWAWLWPHYLAFGVLAGGLVMAEQAIGGYALAMFALPVVLLWLGERQYLNRSRSSVQELRANRDELESANVSLRALVDEKQALVSRMHRSYLSTITSLARTIEAKDPYTGGHTERVARIACLLAEQMGFGEAEVRAVNVGAVIHDIGKI